MAAPVALPPGEPAILDAIRHEAHPLTGDRRDYDALLALVGDARIVLLGEASHGTHEFYRARARHQAPDRRARLHRGGDRGRPARPASTAWTSTAWAPRCRRSSPISTSRTPTLRGARGRDTSARPRTPATAPTTAAPFSPASASPTGLPAFLLCPLAAGASGHALAEPRLERAIGVIYRPRTERQSHYFAASAARRFDALVHIDRTRAVEPLERTRGSERGEPPETYPTAL